MERFLKFAGKSIRIIAPKNVRESGDRISFWWGITTASINLTKWILEGDDLSGKKVLELGCGLGLSGIGALIRGSEVTFSDYVPEALECTARNVRLNALDSKRAKFLSLDWEVPGKAATFDLIIGAEIIYDYYFHSSLLRLMEQSLAPGGRILLADRKRLVVERFVGRLLSRNFVCKQNLSVFHIGGFPKQEITIFEINRKLA
ncbi:MAG: class I SAM-dependent methyltransferase [Desulfomonilaceae bacterium]